MKKTVDKKSAQWLQWAREIQALSQSGLAFCNSEFDRQRYERLAGIAAEITSTCSHLDKENLKKLFLAHPGYATPKIDVRSAVINEGNILLVQESMDKKWALPGGWADVGDIPSETAVRETEEESGFIVDPIKVIGVFDANRSEHDLEFFHAFKIVFLCKLIGGEAKPSNETLDAAFFSFDKLPPLSHHRTNLKHVNEIKEHLYNPGRKTFFD